MRIPLFIVAFLSTSVIFSQTKIGPVVGYDMHIAGGGPYVGVMFQPEAFRVSLTLNTQLNAATSYRLNIFDNNYRYAANAPQMFGGGLSFGYVFKHKTIQKVKPLLLYRSDYFYTRYGKNGIYFNENGEEYRSFMYSGAPYFSTTQSVAAGVTANFGKGFGMDLTAGAGAYIYRHGNGWQGSLNGPWGQPASISTTVRPDLNLNIAFHYLIKAK